MSSNNAKLVGSFGKIMRRSTPLQPTPSGNQSISNDVESNDLVPTQCSGDIRWAWRVIETMVQPLASSYPLDPSSTVIREIPVDVVFTRISNFMRITSMACTYNPVVANVECTSPELVIFAVTLWKSPASINNEMATILEVQRLQGSSLDMNRVRNHLVHAVCTGEQPTEPEKLSPGMVKNLLHQQVDKRGDQVLEYETTQGTPEALKICLNLLQSTYHDSNCLGMESLGVIVNPSIVCHHLAVATCQGLIFGRGEYGSLVQRTILRYFEDTERPVEETGESRNDLGGRHRIC